MVLSIYCDGVPEIPPCDEKTTPTMFTASEMESRGTATSPLVVEGSARCTTVTQNPIEKPFIVEFSWNHVENEDETLDIAKQ